MAAITHTRRDLRIEAEYLPSSVHELAELRRQLVQMIETGRCSEVQPASAATTADSIIGWLVSKLDGADSLSAPTRSRYRRILGQLANSGGGDGSRGSSTLAGAFLALAGAGAAVAPIIYEPSGYVDQGARSWAA